MDQDHEDRDMGKPQMLEAGKISLAVNDFLRDEFAGWYDFKEMIKNVWEDDRLTQVWIEEIIPEHQSRPPVDCPGMKARFDAILIQQYQKTRMRGGNLSTIGYSHFASQEARQPRSLSVDDLFAISMLPGATGVITGVPGSGKTDIAVSEIYRVAVERPNTQVVHNIAISKEPKNSHYRAKLSGILITMLKHSLEGARKTGKPYPTIWFMDEAQVSRSRLRATSNVALAQQQLTLLIRKLGGFQWLIYQQDVPPREVADFATHRLNKPSRNHKDYADFKIISETINTGLLKLKGIRGWEQRRDDWEKNPIPQNGYYEFETNAISSMEADVWPVEIFNYATSMGNVSLVEYYEALLKCTIKSVVTGGSTREITKEMEARVAMNIYDNLKDSTNDFDRRVASMSFLAHALGWDEGKKAATAEQALSRAIKKIRASDLPVDTGDIEDT